MSNVPTKRRHRGGEIVFDPEERRKYLQGFSERKQQRRAFGLAMQKVKDRQARLEDRREHKKLELERIEEAERQKRCLREDGQDEIPQNAIDVNVTRMPRSTTEMYHDEESTEKWGGQVIVTTTVASLSDDSDQEVQVATTNQSVDKRQRYAGDVTKFINLMKGSIPAKKASRGQARKGNHGAANMSGIGGAANLKLAKKALSKVRTKVGTPDGGRGRGKRRR